MAKHQYNAQEKKQMYYYYMKQTKQNREKSSPGFMNLYLLSLYI